MGIVPIQWVLFGFSFAFGPPISEGFGSFRWSVLRFGEEFNPNYSPTYPLLTFCAYQAAFAIITPALISGSIVGRMKLIPYMIFIFIWTTICYDPLAHWVWASNGWLKKLGTLDFAGGTVVHISSGVSGFVASAILGHRVDYDPHEIGHNLPFSLLGTCLLWIMYDLTSGLAALAIINTNTAAASALLTWVAIDAFRGSVSISGACIAPVVGLVAITPACGYVQPGWALLIGFATACTAGILLPMRFLFGIRLKAEDEMIGLDRTGLHNKDLDHYTSFIFVSVLAHGQSWELFASVAAHTLVQKIKQQSLKNDGTTPTVNGTLEMQYQPNNLEENPVVIKFPVLSADMKEEKTDEVFSLQL
ncbi:unnamed protein product [Didymodactylos carnosus]|uniref:Ammonium transporter AmtB-like domain-containing protein n=1 Tax=Didymodactylos carnosus TaxID=1234261 RepID=A0A813ZQY4_9BILA|nr:unnamed protein product [Didymodactylos carnosus]CAF3685265.1 unnamed protein product [Didymodactylos carnosus]